jgi:adenylate cyclase
MAQSRYKRKLTAILNADVVGYSRLMGDDEEFTIQTLNSHRDLMTAIIEQYSGRVVDAVGDNLLAEFTSAADAVQCAVAVQMKLKKKNENLSDSRKMHFRIGINIGDIVHENNRIYGDGVNIAARIESLADSGGITISRNIYNHIKKKLDFGYEYIGEHTVKNISDPVRVYKIIMDPKDSKNILKQEASHAVEKVQLKKRLTITVSIILILLTVLAGLHWKYNFQSSPAEVDTGKESVSAAVSSKSKPEPAAVKSEEDIEYNQSEGFSIAVLPFVNMSKDPEQEYFCDGITENIISSLAKVPQFLVIARNSTFAYKDKSINVQQIGRELNTKYVIEGSIQKSDKRFRITVQLIETDSGYHIWSESYDRTFQDIFKLQDEITLKILKVLGIKLKTPWSKENEFEGFADSKNFIMYMKLFEYGIKHTREKYAWALKNAEKLITSNPEHAIRYNMLAMIYLNGILIGSCESPKICLTKAVKAIDKSLSIVPNYYWSHRQLGKVFMMKKEYDQAILKYQKAMELNPNYAHTYIITGITLNFSGKPKEALEYLNKGLRLDPGAPAYYWNIFGQSYLLLEEYDKAIQMFKKCLKLEPNNWRPYGGLAVSYTLSGQDDRAKTSIRQLLNLFPGFSIEFYKKSSLYKNPDQLDRFVQAYRNAGVPETSQ